MKRKKAAQRTAKKKRKAMPKTRPLAKRAKKKPPKAKPRRRTQPSSQAVLSGGDADAPDGARARAEGMAVGEPRPYAEARAIEERGKLLIFTRRRR